MGELKVASIMIILVNVNVYCIIIIGDAATHYALCAMFIPYFMM